MFAKRKQTCRSGIVNGIVKCFVYNKIIGSFIPVIGFVCIQLSAHLLRKYANWNAAIEFGTALVTSLCVRLKPYLNSRSTDGVDD